MTTVSKADFHNRAYNARSDKIKHDENAIIQISDDSNSKYLKKHPMLSGAIEVQTPSIH